MSDNYPHYLPLYIFPFEPALTSQNGHPASAEELLQAFLTVPEKKDLCWDFLVGLVERKIEHGYDYSRARASFALFLQKALNPRPLQITLESISSPKQGTAIENCHTGSARRIWRKGLSLNLDIDADHHNLDGHLDHHERQIEKLVFLLRSVLGEHNAALKTVCLSRCQVEPFQFSGETRFRSRLRFMDNSSDTAVYWETVGVGTSLLKASTEALNDGFAFRLDPRFLNHTFFQHPDNLRNEGKWFTLIQG